MIYWHAINSIDINLKLAQIMPTSKKYTVKYEYQFDAIIKGLLIGLFAIYSSLLVVVFPIFDIARRKRVSILPFPRRIIDFLSRKVILKGLRV